MEVEMGCFDESVGKSFAHQEPSKSHRSVDASAAGARPSANLCFDCSICLDFAVDPVVTLCGHLYCWPCIYKWLQVETTSPQQCPVCKSPLSQNALVPLYGRGSSNLTAKSKGLNIPNRPAVLRNAITSATDEQQHPYNTNSEEYIALHRPMQQQPHHHHYYPSPWGGTRVFSSTAGGGARRHGHRDSLLGIEKQSSKRNALAKIKSTYTERKQSESEDAGEESGEFTPPALGLPLLLCHFGSALLLTLVIQIVNKGQ